MVAQLKVGIIGGGLSGLATSLELLRLGCTVTVFDARCRDGVAQSQNGYYATASAVAGGLLHPLSPSLKISWQGAEAMSAATKLLAEAETFAGRPLTRSQPLTRPCQSPEDALKMSRAAEVNPDWLQWLGDGLLYRNAVCVEMGPYLAALGGMGLERGLEWRSEDVSNPEDLLPEFGRVVCCGGARGFGGFYGEMLDERQRRGISMTRGQTVLLSSTSVQRSEAKLRGDYFVPEGRLEEPAILGATHQHLRDDDFGEAEAPPDPSTELLKGPLSDAFRTLCADYEPIATTAALRLNGKRTNYGRLPFVAKPKPNLWLASGLGSRGLLRHAHLASLVAPAIITDDLSDVPMPLRIENDKQLRSSRGKAISTKDAKS